MSLPLPRPDLATLRARYDVRATVDRPVLPFGCAALDSRIAARGLALDALHEAAPATPAYEDDAATTLFLAGIAGRSVSSRGGVLWVVTRFDLYAPGLEQAGLAPQDVIFAEARDDRQALALIEDGLRHGGLSAVVGEVVRTGLTETRRLQLASADAASPVLLLRRRSRSGQCPLSLPSAALTRWRVAVAPSASPTPSELGRPRWAVELVRQRGGEGFACLVEGCDGEGRLGVPSPAPDRAAPAWRPTVVAA